MATAKIVGQDGSEGSTLELNDAVFDVPANVRLMHQVVMALQANARQGNAETKTRSQVSGGGKKPFRQKGTGQARQGSSREPKMRGGGIVWGPHKRSYWTHVPLKMRRKALSCALSDRLRNSNLFVLDALKLDTPRTKPMAELVKSISPEGHKTLVVTAQRDGNVMRSAGNVAGLTVRTAADVNALDVLGAKRVLVVRDAIAVLENRLS